MHSLTPWLLRTLLALTLLLTYTSSQAATIYRVSIDSGSLFGDSGFIDLQFNPGDITAPAATAIVSDFSGDATLESGAVVDGNVSGSWSASLHFMNDTPFNAVLQPVTFGNAFAFTINFSGAYETVMTGSGTRFSLALLDPAFNPLATVDPAGTVAQFELMPGGGVEPMTFDADAAGAPALATLVAVPVPAALPLLASALALLAFVRRRTA